MGWQIGELKDQETIHGLVFHIMEQAERARGEEGARRVGRFLYGTMSSMECLVAFREGTEEPFGLSIFSPRTWEFLYVRDGDEEVARSLVEYTLEAVKPRSPGIYSPYPRWHELTGQDLLSPQLERRGFGKLTLARMEAPLDDPALAASLQHDDLMKPLRARGYLAEGWKKSRHLDDFCRLLINNPSPLPGYLFDGPTPESQGWAEDYVFYGPFGDEYVYPAECSTVLLHDGKMAGALLCEERGWIHQIIVDAPHQRKGLAKAMVQKAWKALSVLGSAAMGLSVYRENEEALQWYQRLGLKETGAHSLWACRKENIP